MLEKIGEFPGALKHYESALEIKLKIFGKETDPHIADTYNDIGVLYYIWKIPTQAIEFHKKGLDIKVKTIGENHQSTADSFNNIANVL